MIDNQIVAPGQLPEKQGLYDPANEKDACGVGFVANIKGVPSHQIMLDAYHINSRMDIAAVAALKRTLAMVRGFYARNPIAYTQNSRMN